MSRIGKKPVTIPAGVKIDLKGQSLNVQGPKGKLDLDIHPRMKVEQKDNEIHVTRPTDINTDRALHGLTRSLIQNMFIGVTDGYQKDLEIDGVGFKAQMKGKVLNLNLGYTHTIEYPVPAGIELKLDGTAKINVSGADKQLVGQVAADIRSFHEPEPYKGKGIHYAGEQFRRKQGKTVG